jgi:glyoxylase-like metal-dependent hydrolase (beta-lactamase superfamily II)
MDEVSRRSLLTGAAAGAAALGPLSGADAAAPRAGKQAHGFYRYRVGAIEVTVATDGAQSFPLTESYVVNAPIEEVRKALQSVYMPPNRMTHHYAPIVLNMGRELIVIDTGFGPAAFKKTRGQLGQFTSNLAAAGIDPKDVDLVVISHFHPDHVNGLLDAENKLAFPNAEVLVPAEEWKFWMDDGEMSRAPEGRMQELFANNRRVFDALGRKVTPYVWGRDIVRGLTPLATVGHSIGHTSFMLSSGFDQLFIQSDVTNNPDLFARHPDWGAFFDQDPQLAVTTRREVYDMLVATKTLVQGFHYPFPGLAHVEAVDGGYRVVPMPWHPTM